MSSSQLITPQFPHFRLLPPEIRDVIWSYFLYPSSEIHEVTLARNRWDPLDHEAYAGESTELDERNIWFFAMTPARNLPPHLFICKDAFDVGIKYYHKALQSGHILQDKDHFRQLVEDYEPSHSETYHQSSLSADHRLGKVSVRGVPPTKHQHQPLNCSSNSVVHLRLPPFRIFHYEDFNVANVSSHLLTPSTSIHVIHASNPLSYTGIRFLAVDMRDFFGWIGSAFHATLLFEDVEIVFLVTSGTELMEGRAIFGERVLGGLRETVEQTKWGVRRFEVVGCVEDARRFVEEM